jgi:hypothetical protein
LYLLEGKITVKNVIIIFATLLQPLLGVKGLVQQLFTFPDGSGFRIQALGIRLQDSGLRNQEGVQN